jgi:hypothetical protein
LERTAGSDPDLVPVLVDADHEQYVRRSVNVDERRNGALVWKDRPHLVKESE